MPDYAALRRRMVERQLVPRGIRHPGVLRVMGVVPRERFVPEADAPDAYEDSARPIGEAQTISQPYVVALMLEALDPKPTDRVLEIGTGSAYATALLAELVAEVYTVERLETLATAARQRLTELHYRNVHVRHGDGTLGWPEHAPYDGIVVTAGGPEVPAPLLPQLRAGRHLVVPIGPTSLLTVDLDVETKLPFPKPMVKKAIGDTLDYLAGNLKTRAEHLATG